MPLTALRLVTLVWRKLASNALKRDQHEIADKVLLYEHFLQDGGLVNQPCRGKKRPGLAGFDVADQEDVTLRALDH